MGGGIEIWEASPIIANNVFTGNWSSFDGGGISCLMGSHPLILENGIFGNTALSGGGGIFCESSSPSICKNFILNNTAMSVMSGGGGIYCLGGSNIEITGNMISENKAIGRYGGGILCQVSNPTINSNIIIGNDSANNGGGIECRTQSDPNITNNLIAWNITQERGGGIACSQSDPMIRNNTITGNTAEERGGGIYCYTDSYPTIINSILWSNSVQSGEGKEAYINNGSTLTISYSDVDGGQASIYIEPGGSLNWEPGMINADPLFVSGPWGDFYLGQAGAGNSMNSIHPRQLENSPCVNMGDPGSEIMGGTTRSDSVPDSGIVDMGYHYPPYTWTDRWVSEVPGEALQIQ